MEPHKFPLSDTDHLIPTRLPLKRSLKDSISDFEDLQRPHKRMSVCWQNHAEESTESRFSNTSGSVPPRAWSLKSETGRAVRGGMVVQMQQTFVFTWIGVTINLMQERGGVMKGKGIRREQQRLKCTRGQKQRLMLNGKQLNLPDQCVF